MARRLTEADKIQINEVYAICHSYSKTAEITGFSAASVRKYVLPNYEPAARERPSRKDFVISTVEDTVSWLKQNDEICVLSANEFFSMPKLWEELLV